MAAPAPRKSRAGLVIAVLVVIAAVLAVLYFGGYLSSPAVKVTGTNWTINYNGATRDYFGPSPQSTCDRCPFNVLVGGQFTYTITLTSTAIILDHNINNVTIEGPFTLVSVSPTLPISVTPGGSATITLTIQAPSSGGSLVLAGAINTT